MRPSTSGKGEVQAMNALEQKLKQTAAAQTQMTGWVYWQRDPSRSPNCWTKVFAVLDNAFLWLFQQEAAPRTLLVQVAVASVDSTGDDRLLRVVGPSGEQLCICLSDDLALARWSLRLQEAADLTAAFFRSSGLGVHDLPRWSNYRGTLEEYCRVSKRTRCKDAVKKIARHWSMHQLFKHNEDQGSPEADVV
ncbi:unnamed protein product [Phytophthora lilii]|uniref:Unnamed protein product n=1 Tax=Phytophthora lilii TaxID=2077276 RepID=A0A9W6TNX6_9STRA|nr:unnamed protein product [Phytophthora lilii]